MKTFQIISECLRFMQPSIYWFEFFGLAGGSIGLFNGMSLMVPIEILSWIFLVTFGCRTALPKPQDDSHGNTCKPGKGVRFVDVHFTIFR